MALELIDLDGNVRREMLAELDRDLASGLLYYGHSLSVLGRELYPTLLREAMIDGTDELLAEALSTPGLFETYYERPNPTGGSSRTKVPVTAPLALAEAEFNRFYLRGLCRHLLYLEAGVIEIYRARPASPARPESEAMIGRQLDPEVLLAALREHIGVDTALGLPRGPSSGLSGRFAR
ncbi:MAG TPA: hypothetical protein VGH56_02205 [Solirubrobacteraceae bacterium]|jgi:hypothetical protein